MTNCFFFFNSYVFSAVTTIPPPHTHKWNECQNRSDGQKKTKKIEFHRSTLCGGGVHFPREQDSLLRTAAVFNTQSLGRRKKKNTLSPTRLSWTKKKEKICTGRLKNSRTVRVIIAATKRVSTCVHAVRAVCRPSTNGNWPRRKTENSKGFLITTHS